MENLYVVSNMILTEVEESLQKNKIDYEKSKENAPRFRTFFISDASPEEFRAAMPERFREGEIVKLKMKDAVEAKIACTSIIHASACFFQIIDETD